MKRRDLLLILLGLTALVAVVACQKSRYCLCTSTDAPVADTIVINTDRSLKCNRLMKVGKQELRHGQYDTTLYTYSCEQIHKDSVSTYPNMPMKQ